MQNRQYTVGEFAAINKISARMLRHYDKLGLFKPVTILPNGYRAYSSEQITEISQIKQYQGCGFTLSEIEELLHADEAQIRAMVKEKQAELRTRDAGCNHAYERLCGLLGQQQTNFENQYALSFTMQEDRLLFYCRELVPEDGIETSFDRLYGGLEALDVSSVDLPILLSEGMEDALYRTAAPVGREVYGEGFACMKIPKGWYLSTLHFGDYGSIGAAYDRLLQYMDGENKSITPPFMERYFLDRIHTANPNEYITEVSVKITP